MRRIALPLVLVFAAALVAGCGGGGSSDPEEAMATASRKVDEAEGALLLAEVELDQAYLAEDERTARAHPRQGARAIAEDLRRAKETERTCHEGDGLESCTEIEAIESVVEEIEAEARIGPRP